VNVFCTEKAKMVLETGRARRGRPSIKSGCVDEAVVTDVADETLTEERISANGADAVRAVSIGASRVEPKSTNGAVGVSRTEFFVVKDGQFVLEEARAAKGAATTTSQVRQFKALDLIGHQEFEAVDGRERGQDGRFRSRSRGAPPWSSLEELRESNLDEEIGSQRERSRNWSGNNEQVDVRFDVSRADSHPGPRDRQLSNESRGPFVTFSESRGENRTISGSSGPGGSYAIEDRGTVSNGLYLETGSRMVIPKYSIPWFKAKRTEDVTQWIKRYEAVSRAFRWNDAMRLDQMTHYLVGRAKK
jgi:hypothetical protein